MGEGDRAQTIAIDAMGNDLGPEEIVEGLRLALNSLPAEGRETRFILFGDEDLLRPILSDAHLLDDRRIVIHPTTEVISMDDKPLVGLKKKTDASMVRAIEAVREGVANAVLSCGNTGALMAGGTLRIRPLGGVERPALATIIPTRHTRFILLDAGANPDATAVQLCQNAILGSHYARVVLGRERPKVGLLTIGTEEGKGGNRIKETHDYLKKIDDLIDYRGLIEGFQVFEDRVDVVVCDGFVGNIVLKVSESLFKMLKGYLKDELAKNWLRQFGALLSVGAFNEIKRTLNPSQFGAAPLLGLRAPVLKAHGSSTRDSIAGAIHVALDTVRLDMTERIQEDIRTMNERILPVEEEI
ncbi:MAG: phosphate acyltransferase PlsX [Puniceicoccaceae bacterium]